MVSSAWANSKLSAAHMLAAVLDLEAMGCSTLEFRSSSAKYHIAGSRHVARAASGMMCAADMQHDGAGDLAEKAWFLKYGQYIAWGHGLSVTCGLYGYVPNHSPGEGMHMHIDDGPLSNVGKGLFSTPGAAHPQLPAWPVRAYQKRKGLVADGIVGILTTKALQKDVGTTPDGVWGVLTTKGVQKRVGSAQDGILGPDTYMRMGLAVERRVL